jgi:hypothetical protein
MLFDTIVSSSDDVSAIVIPAPMQTVNPFMLLFEIVFLVIVTFFKIVKIPPLAATACSSVPVEVT